MPRYIYDEQTEGMAPIDDSADVGNQYLLQDELGPAPAQPARTLRDVSGQARSEMRSFSTPRMERELVRGGHEWIDEFGGSRTIRPPQYRQVQRGWDTEMRPVEESPDTVYATNIPGTAEKWRGQGKKPYFVDEMNNEISTPEGGKISGWTPPERQEELRTEKKKADLSNKPPGPKPSKKDMSLLDDFEDFWGKYQKESGMDEPVNPAIAGEKARQKMKSDLSRELMHLENMGQLGGSEYKRYEKMIEDAAKTAETGEKWKDDQNKERKRYAYNLFVKERSAGEKEQGGMKRTDVQAAQEYGRRTMADPNSINLTEEEKIKLQDNKTAAEVPLIGRQLRPEKLMEINRVRSLSGLPPLEEKKNKKEFNEYRDWGLFKTGKTKTFEDRYEYPESKYQYGTAPNGRRVKRDINGKVSYAD